SQSPAQKKWKPNTEASTTAMPRTSPPLPTSHASFDATILTSSRALEPEVLERLRRAPVQRGRAAIVASPLREVALCDPGCGLVRARRELGEGVLRLRQHRLRLLETSLLEQRAPEHEPRVADLVEPVLALAEQRERVSRVALGGDRVARPQVRLRERRDRGRGLVAVADLAGDRERLLEALDRPLGLAEQEVEDAEVVQQAADVRAIGQLLVRRLRPLRVRPREHPLPVALGDERSLEVRLAERARIT